MILKIQAYATLFFCLPDPPQQLATSTYPFTRAAIANLDRSIALKVI